MPQPPDEIEVPTRTIVVYKNANSAGVMSGTIGSVFALLGIFSFGLIFLPFAVLFSLVSILRGIVGLSLFGIVIAFVSTGLTIVGFIVSPTVWLAIAAFLGLNAYLH